MSETIVLQTRIDAALKAEVDALFKSMGTTTTDAVRMFLVQCLNRGKIPFELSAPQPNKATIEAIRETRGGGGKTFSSAQELFEDLGI